MTMNVTMTMPPCLISHHDNVSMTMKVTMTMPPYLISQRHLDNVSMTINITMTMPPCLISQRRHDIVSMTISITMTMPPCLISHHDNVSMTMNVTMTLPPYFISQRHHDNASMTINVMPISPCLISQYRHDYVSSLTMIVTMTMPPCVIIKRHNGLPPFLAETHQTTDHTSYHSTDFSFTSTQAPRLPLLSASLHVDVRAAEGAQGSIAGRGRKAFRGEAPPPSLTAVCLNYLQEHPWHRKLPPNTTPKPPPSLPSPCSSGSAPPRAAARQRS